MISFFGLIGFSQMISKQVLRKVITIRLTVLRNAIFDSKKKRNNPNILLNTFSAKRCFHLTTKYI